MKVRMSDGTMAQRFQPPQLRRDAVHATQADCTSTMRRQIRSPRRGLLQRLPAICICNEAQATSLLRMPTVYNSPNDAPCAC